MLRPRNEEKPAGRLGRALAVAAGAVVALLLAGVAILYFGRQELVRQAALAWVRAQGVQADVRFTALGATGLKARVRIGPADHPDLTVDQAEVSYSLKSFLGGKGLAVSAVTLERPVLVGRWRQGTLSLGEVDKLLKAVRLAPGAPAGPSPRIAIRQGMVRLSTDYGPMSATADADITQNRLDRIDAVMAPTTLRGGGALAVLQGARVRAALQGDRLRLGGRAEASRVSLGQGSAAAAALDLQADLAYAALEQGWLDGRATASLTIASVSGGGASASRATIEVQAADLKLDPAKRRGAAGLHLRVGVDQASAAGAQLARTRAEGFGSVKIEDGVPALRFSGSASGDARWKGLGPPAKGDAPVMAAVKTGLASFHWSAAKAEVSLDHGRLEARLLGPVRAAAANGGVVTAALAGAGYHLTMTGGGLPEATADIRDIRIARGVLSARAAAKAAFSLGLLEEATIQTQGLLSARGQMLSFVPSACAPVTAKTLDLGANSARDFSAEACPGPAPMLTVSPGRWVIAGKIMGAAAKIPSFELGLSGGAGDMTLVGRGAKLSADMKVETVKVTDLAKPLRFHPVLGSGHAAMAGDVLSGAFDARTPKGATIAHADLRQQLSEMKGGMTVQVPALTFARGVLQPTDLSPLTAALGEPATGQVSFQGRFDWAGDKVTSRGTLAAKDLNFRSPAGPVSDLSGEMQFSSLAPLMGATTKPIHAARIAALVPLTEVIASARIDDQTVTVTGAQGSVGGGTVKLNAVASLAGVQTVKGLVTMDKVQVHDLIQGSPFSDKLSMTAQVSGKLPFQMTGNKLRFTDGAAAADGPGRLSISRKTFDQGGIAGSASQDNLATFGYQAMENLAFETLEAKIGSLADGRLGLVFHIKGRHDPPVRKELRLTWRDFFDRGLLNKTMPLPSGTEVNLTLDTTLNLDNLIQSYADLHQPAGSPPVQPHQATLGATITESPQ